MLPDGHTVCYDENGNPYEYELCINRWEAEALKVVDGQIILGVRYFVIQDMQEES